MLIREEYLQKYYNIAKSDELQSLLLGCADINLPLLRNLVGGTEKR